jgi:superfamily I DNA/RNA helicase/RecB family exonuclease
MSLPELRVAPADWPVAIAEVAGPQLIVAGPGTGKTEFLVRRAVHLVSSGTAPPDQIQILTFSRRAAADIGRRVGKQLGPGQIPVPSATFHSFAHRLLESHGPKARGWEKVPSLLTGPEQVALVSDLLAGEDPTGWPLPHRPLLGTATMAEEVADFLLRARERLLDREALEARAAERPEWRALARFMGIYDAELARRGRIDYGALLAEAVAVIEHPEVASALSEQVRFLLVDEYQDTSPAQARLLAALVARHGNITAAADPYQSVYSFRGAEVANVVEFEKLFSDLALPPRRLVLTESFRVPAAILEAALRVVAGGDLAGGAGPVQAAGHGGKVEAYVFDQATAEAEWIAAEAERMVVGEGLRWSDLAVLVRTTRHLLPELSRSLGRRRIPHDLPDRRLVDHPAIQLVFDLVRAATAGASEGRSEEVDRSLRRILLGPLFALPLSAERSLFRARLRRPDLTWSAVLTENLAGSEALSRLLDEPGWAAELPASHGFWHLWTSLPQLEGVVSDPGLASYRQAFAAFSQVLDRQEERDPSATLVQVRRLAEQDDFEATPLLSLEPTRGDRLTLTTLHQAKGLEFEVVFIADAAEGSFPDLRRSRALLRPELLSPSYLAAANPVRLRLQEEMRLAYTAITRARRRVVWTATSAAIDEGERRPSRFLLAAGGVTGVEELGPPTESLDRRPVTPTEAQAALRRLLIDASRPPGPRLAALAVLAHPPRPLWDVTSIAGVAAPGPDRGIIDPPLALSPSQADAYAACPRRYVFERRIQTSQESGPYAHFGSLLHQVLEEAERTAVSQQRPNAGLEAALEILDRAFAAGADFGSPVLNRAWQRRGRKLIEQMYAEWPGGEAVPVALERRLGLELDGHRWWGRSDRIEQHRIGQLRVVDYKTSKTALSVQEAAASLQLGFYLLAAAADPELRDRGEVTEAELWYPLGGTRRQFDRRNLPAVAAQLREIAASIEGEDWTPSPGPGCGRCSLRLVCPAWPEGREGFVP